MKHLLLNVRFKKFQGLWVHHYLLRGSSEPNEWDQGIVVGLNDWWSKFDVKL